MKKFIKIIFINIIIFILLIFISSIFIDKNIKDINNFYLRYNPFNKKINVSKIKIDNYATEEFTAKKIELKDSNSNLFGGEFRLNFGENYTKKPIIILGCSYAYGHGLKIEETFPCKLSQITKRPVYNFAICGGNALLSLSNLKYFANNKYNQEKIKNAEYVIYVYMHDHINRYLSLNTIYSNYKILSLQKNIYLNKLLYIPVIRLIWSIYQIKKISMADGKNTEYYNKFLKNSEQYLKYIMMVMHNEIKKYSPNAKIIIILYDQKIAKLYDNLKIKYDTDIQNSKIWDELNNETDMTIVHSKDITGFLFDKNYKLKEDIADWHPNAKAWEVFTPMFAEKYIK